ncbi:Pleckstrin y domain-containing family A member 3 [Orchesella cincta]|uniref:Pleckstrin y domain-containing family A member 3 n=1 Tax=Orchesella cincta TaxID=48709 RepID=A0A1D2N572_ORCCI|nr:Pleckstrin y domain-containing family A member 3 [Orchesella cincta]
MSSKPALTSMKGVLWKWTNYWNGWQPRWFILEEGILSYYQSEDEVSQGCKGSVCVAACDINFHHTDPLRLDIVIQGEQHIYVRAASPTERQQWLVALGSAKAQGLITRSKRSSELATTPDDVKAKKSELRLYCDLLMQQVHSIKEAATENPQPDVNKLDECTSLLSATCDTFIKTLDECVKIANASPSYAISTPPPLPSLPVPAANSVCKSGKIKSIIHSNSH